MCNFFVIHGQVTPKWVVWSGPKSNSSELLCLSWLPATLIMIRSKMNELARRQNFPSISLWEILRRSRAANSVVSGPIWPKFELVRDFMHVLVTCKYKKDRIQKKKKREKMKTSFSPLCQWGLSVAMEASVLIQSAPNIMLPFSHPSDATHKIWSRLANWLQRLVKFESVDDDDGRRRTIGILKAHLVSLRLRWAYKSKYLKVTQIKLSTGTLSLRQGNIHSMQSQSIVKNLRSKLNQANGHGLTQRRVRYSGTTTLLTPKFNVVDMLMHLLLVYLLKKSPLEVRSAL